MIDKGYELDKSLNQEQKRINLSGINIVFGPIQSAPGEVSFELDLPDLDRGSMEEPKYPSTSLMLPDNPIEQGVIMNSLPELARQAKGSTSVLYESLSNLIESLKTK